MSRITLIVLAFTITPRASSAAPPQEFTNTVGMKFKLLPAGEFTMGTPVSDNDALDCERPQHRVRITKPFYLGATEVTQEQYKRVQGKAPSLFKGVTLPVERISWNDAATFCKKLSATECRTYRLPTEAEWEYACRAGSRMRYFFGDEKTLLDKYAWFSQNSGRKTHPVGEKKPNDWGLYDMYGNVFEWCSDSWRSDYYMSSPRDDPGGPAIDFTRVLRGGAFASPAPRCRSAFRLFFPKSFHTKHVGCLGFRVAASQEQEQQQTQVSETGKGNICSVPKGEE